MTLSSFFQIMFFLACFQVQQNVIKAAGGGLESTRVTKSLDIAFCCTICALLNILDFCQVWANLYVKSVTEIRIQEAFGRKKMILNCNSYTLIISIGMGSSSTATQKIVVRN